MKEANKYLPGNRENVGQVMPVFDYIIVSNCTVFIFRSIVGKEVVGHELLGRA